MNRRRFLGYGAAALAGSAIPGVKTLGATAATGTIPAQRGDYKDLVREAISYRKIDLHNHINESSRKAADIDESCRRVGINYTAVSNLGGRDPESIREHNNLVLEGMRQYPDRILGSCFVNPGYTRESLEEIDRCVDQGMVMVGELYDDYKINDPVYFPIIERCIEHKIPIMMHAAAPLGNWRPEFHIAGVDSPTNTSNAEDFIEVSERYPEAMIICGHIGGGGDWEFAINMLREAPNIYAETSGSVADNRMIDLAVDYLGADRLVFATDVNYETAVGKIMNADLTEEERKKIFFDNFNNLLKPAGNNVD
ncbi:MAG: amidohydrolase family protein [Balneolaceae bacterium]